LENAKQGVFAASNKLKSTEAKKKDLERNKENFNQILVKIRIDR